MHAQWKTFAGVALVFVLGCAAGVLGSSAFFAHRVTLFLQRGAPAYVDVLEERFTRGLHLDSDQKTQIHQVLMGNLQQRVELQKQIQPEIRAINADTLRQIKTILHPDQMETFRTNVADFRHKFGRGRLFPHALDADTNGAAATPPTNAAPDQPAPPP